MTARRPAVPEGPTNQIFSRGAAFSVRTPAPLFEHHFCRSTMQRQTLALVISARHTFDNHKGLSLHGNILLTFDNRKGLSLRG